MVEGLGWDQRVCPPAAAPPEIKNHENNKNKIPLNSNTGNKQHPDTLQIATTDTSYVASNNNQSLMVPLNSIDLLSSSSNDSDLTNGTFCSPIDEKANNDEEIINKIKEAIKLQFKVGQVFKSVEDCKRTIKAFAEPLGFVASINDQSLVCN